jgi:hypothetical protein
MPYEWDIEVRIMIGAKHISLLLVGRKFPASGNGHPNNSIDYVGPDTVEPLGVVAQGRDDDEQ